ncbi:hypothetical protein B0H10DRAFT_2038353 [Mycena sp. CBHHK59/15]|nr:hypothetical protein B0H10DRAFT_2038353 [Mycena sp. CBHHK59/15]
MPPSLPRTISPSSPGHRQLPIGPVILIPSSICLNSATTQSTDWLPAQRSTHSSGGRQRTAKFKLRQMLIEW